MSEKDLDRQDASQAKEKHDESFGEHAQSSMFDDEKAAKTQGDYSGAVSKTYSREIRLVRKLDMRIMPIVGAMYFLNYVDRNAIASARLNGLEDDLGLGGTQYNTCISILFVGYLLMQIPSNMLMSSGKVRASVYMSVCMGSWAVVSACTALTKKDVGLVMVRFFLGITEAPFYPGPLFLLSLFYTSKEIALRIFILYSGNVVATAMSGLIALATFETLDKRHGLKGWQWLFIIEGVVTFGVAVLGLFMLPVHPLATRWLTFVNVVANASYVYTAYLYPDTDGPRYLIAMSSNAAFGAATIASAWALRWWLQATNRKTQQGAIAGAADGVFYAY
ncbi:major facilitator superfamily domain-containing protein [Aspergillus undulatus]|uniref:major facilitator superfamily domain-containing protein n=1 Tax=Aspergillus undulatus TaxID=1810928 RepID=UPI003CCD4DC9